jgi:RHS repeat-associated protein
MQKFLRLITQFLKTTYGVLRLVLIALLLSAVVMADSATDSSTPLGLAPGSPSGTFSLTAFDNVNFFNGNLDFHMPLLRIGGRGSAGYTMMLGVEQKWRVEHGFDPSSNQHYYSPDPNWWGGLDLGLNAAVLEARGSGLGSYTCPNEYGSPPRYTHTWTRLTFTTADGTEYELRDQLTGGKPAERLFSAYCLAGFNRGRVFVTADGTAASFVSDSDVIDAVYPDGPDTYAVSGYLMLRDGTRYRIDSGQVTWIRDRNGNRVTFNYSGWTTTVTDSLNRTVTVTRQTSDAQYGSGTRISYKGFSGATRTIFLSYVTLSNALQSGSPQTYQQLFPELNGSGSTQFNPSVVGSIWLPNGQRYRLLYNVYGEISRVILPTSGAIEYEWASGVSNGAASGSASVGFLDGGVTNYQVYRRVIRRSVYKDQYDSVPESTITISRPETVDNVYYTATLGYVDVEQRAGGASGTLSARQRHYFYGSAAESFQQRPGSFSRWQDGREYRTDVLDANGTTVLRRANTTWQQRASVSWWSWWQSQFATAGSVEPPNDTRVSETVSTIEPAGANLVSKQTFSYDDSVPYNNQSQVYEYEFGTGVAGALVRRTQTSYVTTSSYTDAQGGAHIRSLPLQISIYDGNGSGVERARTTNEFDNYAFDSNHAPLTSRSNISGLDSAFTTGYTTRGNATGSTRYLLVNESVMGSVSAYSQYDVAGNIVKTIDGRGNATTYGFNDYFGTPNGEARTNTAPTELGSQSSFAFPTQVTNAMNHTGYAQFDYHLGQVVDSEDANGVVASGFYSDTLDRPTQIIRAANLSSPPKNQTTFVYDDVNHTVTTTSDLNTFNDLYPLKTQVFYDGLGRSVETRQFEGASNYIAVQTQYDAMGRAFKTSNPFRSQSESASWTTSNFDALGRVTSITTPDNAVVATSYAGNTITLTDQTGKKRRSVTDSLGRLIRVDEPDANNNLDSGGTPIQPTNYSYDVLDNLTAVTQGTQQPRTFIYDSLKRLTSASNPESGTVGYQYDDNGNLLVKTDARTVTTHFSYDALNRAVRRWYNGSSSLGAITHNSPALPSGVSATDEVKYFYDSQGFPAGAPSYQRGSATGRLVATTYGGGSNGDYFGYDALGRATIKIQQTGAINYQVTRSYNLASGVTSQSYPSEHTVTYNYDAAGRLGDKDASNLAFSGNLGDGVGRNYATGIQYSPWGGLSREKFGTDIALYHRQHYTNRGQLFDMRVSTLDDGSWNRGAIINYYSLTNYGFGNTGTDTNGNVYVQQHWVPHNDQMSPYTVHQQNYAYDSLNRIAWVGEYLNAATHTGAQFFTYDRWGNRRIDPASWGTGINIKQFDVEPTNNRLIVPSGQPGTMSYDAAGNLTTDSYSGEGSREYNAENKMTRAWGNGQWQTYSYDGDGQRIKRIVNGTELWQVYGFDGELLAEYSAYAAPSFPQKEYGYRNGELLITASGANCGVGYQGAKSWSATNGALGHIVGHQEGSDWVGSVNSDSAGYFSFGPYDNGFGQGHHSAGFRLQVDNTSGSDVVATLDVVTAYGGTIVSQRQLRRNEFTAANQWQWFTLEFDNPCFGLVEARIYWHDTVNLRFNQLTITGINSAGLGVNWLVADHLGTPRMVFDKTGSLASTKRHDYLPFGEELFAGTGGRTASNGYTVDTVRQKFTSKERDNETALDYFGARYYASTQGRFTGVDPIKLTGERLFDPTSLNLYAYCRNNPLKYLDPDGEDLVLANAGARTRIRQVLAPGLTLAEQRNIRIAGNRVQLRNPTAISSRTASPAYRYLSEIINNRNLSVNYYSVAPGQTVTTTDGITASYQDVFDSGGLTSGDTGDTVRSVIIPVGDGKLEAGLPPGSGNMVSSPEDVVFAHEAYGHALDNDAVQVENEYRRTRNPALGERSGEDHQHGVTVTANPELLQMPSLQIITEIAPRPTLPVSPPKKLPE